MGGRKETLTFAKFIASTANPMSSTRFSTKQDMIVTPSLLAQLVSRALSTTERELETTGHAEGANFITKPQTYTDMYDRMSVN